MESQAPGLAVYQRVADAIKREIRSGTRKPGERLPGNRQLANDFAVSLGTAQKALRVLQDEGWLVATPAVGVFVTDHEPAAEAAVTPVSIQRQLDELRAATNRLADRVEQLEQNAGR